FRILPYAITGANLTNLTADKVAPQPVGTAITLTATATGGAAPYSYKWWQFDGTAWTVLQDWDSSASVVWRSAKISADAQISVWVRSTGNLTDTYESYKLTSFAITPPPPATISTVTADKSAPQPPGTTVTFTATASGGKPPYQFKWWVYDGTMWTMAQDWSASPTFAWTPSVANAADQLSTWVRSSGNLTDTYENYLLSGAKHRRLLLCLSGAVMSELVRMRQF